MNPLEILHRTPKTNCGECGYPTCLAFAAAVTRAGADINVCPYIDLQGLEATVLSSKKDLEDLVHACINNRNRTNAYRRNGVEDERFVDDEYGADWDTDNPVTNDVTNLRNHVAKAAKAAGVKLTIGVYPKDTTKHPADMDILYAVYRGVSA